MAKTIKFNLICDGQPVRTIEDLQENFSVEDMLGYFESGLLLRWLKVRDYKDEYKEVSKISTKDDLEIAKKLIKIFNVETDEKEIAKDVYMLQFLKERSQKISKYDSNRLEIDEVVKNYTKKYADLVKEQLPELDSKQILLEPARRNTAPCIAWASYHIRSLNPDANIVVAPSDHLILKEGEFLAAIEKGLDFVSKSDKLLTLGIKPNRPETGYGYIQIAEQEGDNFYKVKTFTEKPELELAKVFVESGEFYWNSGLFMWNVNTIIKAGEALLPELASKLAPGKDVYGTPEEKAFIEENFPACPNVSIDFGIMEKADNVYVSLGDFGWSDLGTWGSLYDLSPKDEQGNVTLKCDSMIYNSNNNIVVLPKGKLAVIEGLEGFLVAESDNVLLICKKDEEHAIRKYVNDAQMKLGEDYI